MDKNEEVYSHFIQKALVKNFANKGVVNCIKYPNGKLESFNINVRNSKQPIAIKGFYSMEIEEGMNDLESDGINILRKIAQNAQFEKEISLNRTELITLKFYSLLSGARTHKLRNNILNRTGDSLFNKVMDNSKLDSKDIQEKMIRCILKYWHSNKSKLTGDYLVDIENNKDDEIIQSCLINISNAMNSRLLIFKFSTNNLLLTEALNFTEQNKKNGGILLDFMPIFTNVGIAFYFDPIIARGTDVTSQKSEIFKNDISIRRHTNKYVNFDIMKKKQMEYLKNSKNIVRDNKIFWMSEAQKYHHKDDKYIYEVLNEPKATASLCNAMALVHCKNSYVIFQNKGDISDAENMIYARGIYRIEDYQ